jgi:UDP-3-O-[3-hydroxymyristoyl] glucosamine N-acyltransferase
MPGGAHAGRARDGVAVTPVTPADLISGASGVPRPLRLEPEGSAAIARRHGLGHEGADVVVRGIAPLSELTRSIEPVLTYLSSASFVSQLRGRTGLAVVTTAILAPHVPAGNTRLLTSDDPRDAFYEILARAVRDDRFERLGSSISARARIARSAHIDDGVVIEDDAEVGPGAVILANTYVGPGVVIKPNAVIGGDGFENAKLGGRKRIVPHAGGVWLAAASQVGSSTCVDRGLFGEFTFVGEETKIDNLVHFAHAARVGRESSIIACAEISGSCDLGDGVWIGPGAAINPQVTIGSHAFIGTGSVVTRDIPAHALAYGSPAKVTAAVCVCRAKLAFVADRATCDRCRRQYTRTVEGVVHHG